MISARQRLVLATAALIALLLVGYYSVLEPSDRPVSKAAAKIASAKERLQQSLEDQNKNLKHALEAARASIKQAAGAPVATPAAAKTGTQQKVTSGKEGFAYVFYATNDNYACSALVNIRRLKDLLHTTLAVHVLASPEVSEEYVQAIRAAGVVLHIQSPPPLPDKAMHYYKDSLLKLRAFEMHKLSPGLTRVLALDSDQLVMKNMDHLFSDLPAVDLASPRAYWLGKDWLSSTFMLINLSDRLWSTMEKAMQNNMLKTKDARYDMDLVNDVLGDTVMMLSGEYVCLNSHFEDWNLPRWYHAERTLNWTTIKMINDLAKPPQPHYDLSLSSGNRVKEKRQLFTHTDLAVEIPPTPAPLPQTQAQPHTSTLPLAPIMPTPAYPPLPDPIKPPLEPASPSPRFPLNHPLALELHRLQDTAAVIHFSAVGKPWTYDPEMVEQIKPDAHPLLAEQFLVWRDMAEQVCPGGLPEAVEVPKSLEIVQVPKSSVGVMATTEATASLYVTPLSGIGVPVSKRW